MVSKFSSLGVCLGSATISMVVLETAPNRPYDRNDPSSHPKIKGTWRMPHGGDPKQTLLDALDRVDTGQMDRIACTGRKFRELVNLSAIAEPVAVEHAYRFVKPVGVECPAIVSAGGETFMAYVLNRSGFITNVLTGNRCASGTGEFFVQQLRRLDITLAEFAQWPVTNAPYQVSGRCSVFCKSDCTHATNKGIAKSRVTAGLCQMMAGRITSLLNTVQRKHIMLTGGTIHNRMMRAYLGDEIEDIIVPDAADCFEALGAALWALENETRAFPGKAALFAVNRSSFSRLSPLHGFKDSVTFYPPAREEIRAGDSCILGLDVGSTTTKAVLMRESDDALLVSVYLRTNGDPVGAARKCHASLLEQVSEKTDPARIPIIGLGVCGSGRQIAGLHALTDGVINEIIAHATAAVHFDPQVDTLFEIGGQDAKYTYITNGVPSDYAMNEACSAGTGSFLEESALETLGVVMTDIEQIALAGERPPNFNDQCAAFIASDIKTAIHEGIGREDIVAGLVYSICMNYSNRVKGNRPVGRKIFMQGGVCYNKAVPLAMAALVGKPIVVPPEPGLMGAFGVALEVKNRIRTGRMLPGDFDLKTLADRCVTYGKSFICKGGREKCDRRCDIAMVVLEGKRYPFGGACNRYYNIRRKIPNAGDISNLAHERQRMVFDSVISTAGPAAPVIAMNRSFMVNTYYPFHATFFKELGLSILLPDVVSREGIDRCGAAFCYPGELAHGFFHSILSRTPPPDFIFLPHFKSIPSENGDSNGQLCPFVQGEGFYLKTAFRNDIEKLKQQGVRIISPFLDMAGGLEAAKGPMLEAAAGMGHGRRHGTAAFEKACHAQQRFFADLKARGRRLISDLEADPQKTAVVLFGRAYNTFAPEAHMGIPGKFTSRGIPVIPFDALAFEDEPAKRHMYWGTGRQLLQAARLVRKHAQLFGVYITNFSCGPDSFLIGYFREIMGQKPSLTLELDSHTADAGLETRIEAFLDIVATCSRDTVIPATCNDNGAPPPRLLLENRAPMVLTGSGEKLSCRDPRVTLLIPSMGFLATEAVAAAFRGSGFNAVASPPADETVMKLGRAHATCKECLPLILTTGSLLDYIQKRKRPDEVLFYFMATASGPCRFGQYYIFMEDLIRREKIPDVALFSITSENGYSDLKNGSEKRGWWAIIISDVMEDIRAMLLAAAIDTGSAMAAFEEIWRELLNRLEKDTWEELQAALYKAAGRLRRIRLTQPPAEVPLIGLMGEIFVRRDGLSRQWITERLAEKGFAAVCSPIAEWLHYCDYLFQHNLAEEKPNMGQKLKSRVRSHHKTRFERRIKSILSASGLVSAHPIRIGPVIDSARPFLSPELTGEAVLTVGSSLMEVAERFCGILSIGPFGCMPGRLSEAILNESMTVKDKLSFASGNGRVRAVLSDVEDLPFLAVESDGSPFPHQINAKLEAFCLRASRLHARMRQVSSVQRTESAASRFLAMAYRGACRAGQRRGCGDSGLD